MMAQESPTTMTPPAALATWTHWSRFFVSTNVTMSAYVASFGLPHSASSRANIVGDCCVATHPIFLPMSTGDCGADALTPPEQAANASRTRADAASLTVFMGRIVT